jgi:polyribonucleotide nucleotidyltransferase
MDIKVMGITSQIMREALEQARRGRLHILEKMKDALPEARSAISEYAPRFYSIQIPQDKIRDLIGPGGKVIKGIIEQTGVKIEVEDSGRVNVASSDQESAKKALQIIGEITATAEIGKTYLGTVVRLADFGAFVEIIPGTDGLLHISEVAEHRIKDIRDELKEGDQILVKVLSMEGNRIRLSRKAILKEQRAKMSQGETSLEGVTAVTFEGGEEFEPNGGEPNEGEPNFNRIEAGGESHESAALPDRGPRSDRGGRPGGGGRGPGGGGRGGHGGHGGRRGGGGGGGRGRR